MSLIKQSLKEGGTADKQQGQIQSLKKKVSALQQENNNLQKKIPPRTDIRMQDDKMILTEIITQGGKAYQNAKSVSFGEAYKQIRPMVEPLVQISRAAALGNDVVTRRQKAHEIGPDGKPTKDLLQDEDGRQIYLPNARDKAQAISDLLMSDPDCVEALRKISEVVSNQEKVKEQAMKIANARRLASLTSMTSETKEESQDSPDF